MYFWLMWMKDNNSQNAFATLPLEATPTGNRARRLNMFNKARLLGDVCARVVEIAHNVRDSAFAFYSRHSCLLWRAGRVRAAGERREAGGVITDERHL